jgi:hypothetical protein
MMPSLGRSERVGPDAQRLFRVLIDSVLATGGVREIDALAAHGSLPVDGVRALLDELVAADWIAADAAGNISAVYPFAFAPTGIEVTVGAMTRPVMCAVDALGVAPLLRQPATIRATCVQCARAVTISVRPDGIAKRRPRSTVVIRRRAAGPAHATRCGATRFACSPAHAADWLAAHGGAEDVMQSLEVAFIEALQIFGRAYIG